MVPPHTITLETLQYIATAYFRYYSHVYGLTKQFLAMNLYDLWVIYKPDTSDVYHENISYHNHGSSYSQYEYMRITI